MHHSNTLPVTLQVSHGSILGPLLFLIFINDIPTLVKTARLLLFADDINCVKSVNNLFHCSHLQGDLHSLHSWSSSNIAFNQKNSLLRFQAGPCSISVNYFLDNHEILSVQCNCDIVIIISDDISWSAYYNKIVSKAYRTLSLIHRSFGSSINLKIRKLLYISLVRSQLTYSLPFGATTTKRCCPPGICSQAFNKVDIIQVSL